MPRIRVCAFIDGFNVYHALDDLRRPHLKWVDLRRLMACFTDPSVHEVRSVSYFSAYAKWLPGPYARHQQYVAALSASGVTPVMGEFKSKDRSCKSCNATWKAHEEKETDVNIAVHMLAGAFDDEYDQAFLVTGDSDLVAPLRLLRARFPQKKIKILTPPGRRHSKQLWALASHRAAILDTHVEGCLLPQRVLRPDGTLAATRPTEYDPPP